MSKNLSGSEVSNCYLKVLLSCNPLKINLIVCEMHDRIFLTFYGKFVLRQKFMYDCLDISFRLLLYWPKRPRSEQEKTEITFESLIFLYYTTFVV